MRRLTEDSSRPEELEGIREAADESDWCKFNELMGGFHCPRKEQKVKPYYSYKLDAETGEIEQSYFGDSLVEKLVGIVFAGQNIITRIHEWKVERIRTRVHESLGVL